jgi:hypothetical protein
MSISLQETTYLYPFDNPELARLAFHQAGHVVAAVASGIAVHSVTAVVIEEAPPGVKLAPLHEIVALAEADVAKIELVSRYVETRLAGPIAEMIHSAKVLESMDCSISWPRWRARWKAKLLRREDTDLDFAYATIFGWCRCRNAAEIEQRLNQLWKQSEGLLRRSDTWIQVERLVQVLIEHDALTGAEALEVIRTSPS